MKGKVKKPPSKIRYDQSHPTVSIRVTRALYDQLKDLREHSGKSLGDILREALEQQTPSTKMAYQLGHNAAKREFAVHYKCTVCGGNLTVASAEVKQAIARYMRDNGWGHSACVR